MESKGIKLRRSKAQAATNELLRYCAGESASGLQTAFMSISGLNIQRIGVIVLQFIGLITYYWLLWSLNEILFVLYFMKLFSSRYSVVNISQLVSKEIAFILFRLFIIVTCYSISQLHSLVYYASIPISIFISYMFIFEGGLLLLIVFVMRSCQSKLPSLSAKISIFLRYYRYQSQFYFQNCQFQPTDSDSYSSSNHQCLINNAVSLIHHIQHIRKILTLQSDLPDDICDKRGRIQSLILSERFFRSSNPDGESVQDMIENRLWQGLQPQNTNNSNAISQDIDWYSLVCGTLALIKESIFLCSDLLQIYREVSAIEIALNSIVTHNPLQEESEVMRSADLLEAEEELSKPITSLKFHLYQLRTLLNGHIQRLIPLHRLISQYEHIVFKLGESGDYIEEQRRNIAEITGAMETILSPTFPKLLAHKQEEIFANWKAKWEEGKTESVSDSTLSTNNPIRKDVAFPRNESHSASLSKASDGVFEVSREELEPATDDTAFPEDEFQLLVAMSDPSQERFFNSLRQKADAGKETMNTINNFLLDELRISLKQRFSQKEMSIRKIEISHEKMRSQESIAMTVQSEIQKEIFPILQEEQRLSIPTQSDTSSELSLFDMKAQQSIHNINAELMANLSKRGGSSSCEILGEDDEIQ